MVTRRLRRARFDDEVPRRRPRPWYALDRRRALIAAVLLVAVLIGGGFVSYRDFNARTSAMAAKGRSLELATGPIVFLPLTGNQCRQKLIDNNSWRIRDVGTVDCDVALGNRLNSPPREGMPSRVEIIRNGFRNNN